MFPILRYYSAAFLRFSSDVFLGRLSPLLASSSSTMEQQESAGLRLLVTPLAEEETAALSGARWGGLRFIHIRSEPRVIRRCGGRAAAAPEWCVLLPVSQLPQLRSYLLGHDPEPRLGVGVRVGVGLGMIGMGLGGLFLLMLGLGLAFVKDNFEELKPELKKLMEEALEDIRSKKESVK